MMLLTKTSVFWPMRWKTVHLLRDTGRSPASGTPASHPCSSFSGPHSRRAGDEPAEGGTGAGVLPRLGPRRRTRPTRRRWAAKRRGRRSCATSVLTCRVAATRSSPAIAPPLARARRPARPRTCPAPPGRVVGEVGRVARPARRPAGCGNRPRSSIVTTVYFSARTAPDTREEVESAGAPGIRSRVGP